MPKKYIFLSVVAVGCLFPTRALLAQDAPRDAASTPRIFFDCQGSRCDEDYYRTEIPWVSWVRDRQDADAHMIMTSETTGAGGRVFHLDVVGREQYVEYTDEADFQSLPTATERETLDDLSLSIGLAFARFSQYAGFRDLVNLTATQNGEVARSAQIVTSEQVNDPWNLWVFNINGNASLQGEETSTTRRFTGGLSASRVTPTWKQSYRGFLNYNFRQTSFSSRPEFIDEYTDYNFNATVVYSVAELVSLGFTSRVGKSTRQNQAFSAGISPALEFSFWPYDEATRRSLTAFYEVGPVYYEYNELTQDEVIDETVFQQSLTFSIDQRQAWGDLRLNVTGAAYVHDFDRNNLSLGGNVSFRITRGLDLNLGGSYTLVADQLYLPFQELSDDELLAGSRSAGTDKRHMLNLGLSYRFGSIFNNVVNNRFPGGGGSSSGFRPSSGGYRR